MHVVNYMQLLFWPCNDRHENIHNITLTVGVLILITTEWLSTPETSVVSCGRRSSGRRLPVTRPPTTAAAGDHQHLATLPMDLTTGHTWAQGPQQWHQDDPRHVATTTEAPRVVAGCGVTLGSVWCDGANNHLDHHTATAATTTTSSLTYTPHSSTFIAKLSLK